MASRITSEYRTFIPSPLRVLRVASLVSPFAPKEAKGMAEYEGKVAAALASIGIEVRHVVPLFNQTREAIEREGLLKELKETGNQFSVEIPGYQEYATKAYRLRISSEYTVYFLEQGSLYGIDNIFTSKEELVRFSHLAVSALQIARLQQFEPEMLLGADWPGALAISSMAHPHFNRDGFFNNTNPVLGIHAFQFPGPFLIPLPTPLDNGLLSILGSQNGIAYARSSACIENAVEYITNPANQFPLGSSATLIRDCVSKNKLVGLTADDESWNPESKDKSSLPDELAAEFARLELGLFRTLVRRNFGNRVMELAVKPSEHLVFKTLTPRETLHAINPDLIVIYDSLSPEDKKIIDREIESGCEGRFETVKNGKDIQGLLDFLKIAPTCDFEKRLRQEIIEIGGFPMDLGTFIDGPNYNPEADVPLFYPGDLNRLFSVEMDFAESENPQLRQAGRVSLYNAMGMLKNLRPHVIRMIKTLKIIALAEHLTPEKLAEILSTFGHPQDAGKDGLKFQTRIFTMLSAIFNRLAKNKNVLRTLVLAALLHDIGKCLKHDPHPKKGIQILRKMRHLQDVLGEEEMDLLKSLVLHHGTFGDSAVTGSRNPARDIEEVYKVYSDDSSRLSFLECLFIISVADINATQSERGLLSPRNLEDLERAFGIAMDASDLSDLREKMAKVGWIGEKWGNEVWKKLIIREGDSPKDQNLAMQLATNELVRYGRQLRLKNYKKMFKKKLGLLVQHYRLFEVAHKIDDPRMRARLLFRMVELSEHLQARELTIAIGEGDFERLIKVLEKEKWTPLETLADFTFEHDPESGSMKIGI